MASHDFQITAKDGYLRNGEWFCVCGLTQIWHTSHTAANPDRDFLRCSNSARQCRFFLWEDVEIAERNRASTIRSTPGPHTPTKQEPIEVTRTQAPLVFTPPSTQDLTWKMKNTLGLSEKTKNDPGSSPTPLPHSRVLTHPSALKALSHTSSQSGRSAGLAAKVLEILQAHDLVLKSGTEIILNVEIEAYEAKLERYKRTIDELCKQIDGL